MADVINTEERPTIILIFLGLIPKLSESSSSPDAITLSLSELMNIGIEQQITKEADTSTSDQVIPLNVPNAHLTTAASLWAVATLGIAVGAGFIYGAVIGFIFIMLSIKVLQKASRYQENHNRILEVYMELNPEVGMTYVTDYIHNKEFVIRSMQRSCQNTFSADDVAVTMEVDLKISKIIVIY